MFSWGSPEILQMLGNCPPTYLEGLQKVEGLLGTPDPGALPVVTFCIDWRSRLSPPLRALFNSKAAAP